MTDEGLFTFNAPEYYDLDDPLKENEYVNNADGYFEDQTKGSKSSSIQEKENMLLNDKMDQMSLLKQSKRLHSTLMKPTQSYLAKRERKKITSIERRPPLTKQLTIPRSPRIRVLERRRGDESKQHLSSTSRELEQIRQEKLQLQRLRQQTEQYRAHTAAHDPPGKQPVRLTKKLTIPSAPVFETDKRAKRIPVDDLTDISSPPSKGGFVKAEDLMCRNDDDAATMTKPYRMKLTHAHSPQLATSIRAKLREPVESPVNDKAAAAAASFKRPIPGALTMAHSPMLQTSIRASMIVHREMEKAEDEDDVELKKKFHAKPVNRRIFDHDPLKNRKATGPSSRLVPQSPRLATKSRIRSNPHKMALELQEQDYQRRIQVAKERSEKSRRNCGLTAARTPKLKSLQRHKEYQSQFERQKQQKEAQEREERSFKAQPMRISSPPKFSPPELPLTVPEPFEMPGDQRHRDAQARFEKAVRDEAEKVKQQANVKARAMPDLSRAFVVQRSEKPLTEFQSPSFATDRQALKRQEFAEQERQRREREEKVREETKRLQQEREDEELIEMRKTQLKFHAQPIRGQTEYKIKPSEKELTVPQSPSFAHRKVV